MLDSQVVPFLARLRDVRRDELIPVGLAQYEEMAGVTPEWLDVLKGRRTMYLE